MKSMGYTSARRNLAKAMAEVCTEHSPIAIARKGQPSVVMISMEDYQALEETSHLLRSPKNTRHLLEAIDPLQL